MKTKTLTQFLQTNWKARLLKPPTVAMTLTKRSPPKRLQAARHNRVLFLGLASILISSSQLVEAGSVAGTGGSTEITQILNNLQLMNSYAQQVESFQNQLLQYESMLKNLADNPISVVVPDLMQIARNQARIMTMANSIGSSVSKLDQTFAKSFQNPTAASLGTKFGVWTNNNLDVLKSAMLNAGMQRENFQSDQDAIQALVTKNQASSGNLAAVKTLGEINHAQLMESLKLRDLISQQQIAENTFMATQASKDQAVQDANANVIGDTKSPLFDRKNYKNLP